MHGSCLLSRQKKSLSCCSFVLCVDRIIAIAIGRIVYPIKWHLQRPNGGEFIDPLRVCNAVRGIVSFRSVVDDFVATKLLGL